MIITRMRSQSLPFVPHGAEIRDHQFFAELRRDCSETIVSFHSATSRLVCLGQWPLAGARSARVSDYHESWNEYPQSGRLSRIRCAWLATPARSKHRQWHV